MVEKKRSTAAVHKSKKAPQFKVTKQTVAAPVEAILCPFCGIDYMNEDGLLSEDKPECAHFVYSYNTEMEEPMMMCPTLEQAASKVVDGERDEDTDWWTTSIPSGSGGMLTLNEIAEIVKSDIVVCYVDLDPCNYTYFAFAKDPTGTGITVADSPSK